ncbi:hypothetical protein GCM10023224_05140 [Streptomonospora halophila]|uniref:Scaffolding protein n=1 Tax=Streptomonospora halophila TaxID=427369 RepID=A0ABP9G8I4_9ACTN
MQDPTAPGALIGHRSNGRPIYLIAGGSEDAAGQGQQDVGQADTGNEDAQAESLLADAVNSPDDGSNDGEGQAPKTYDEAYVQKLRNEAASRRVREKEQETAAEQARREKQELIDAFAKAAGLKEDDGPPDPEQLTKQLTEAQQTAQERDAELRTLRIERAAEKAARTHSADVDALLDSRSFAQKLAGLDPSADDFAASLDDLVKTTVESNPKYKASQAPAASSADFSSGTGEKRKRPSGLFDAVSRTYG